jgi:hypothetical protein
MKVIHQHLLRYMVEKGDAENNLVCNNMIDESLLIKFSLTIFEQILVVINLSYIIGMLWLILCGVVEDFVLNTHFEENNAEAYPDHFLVKFGLVDKDPAYKAVSVMYFSFTSLSTVGFGDFYPVSDIERVSGAMILLFGVACFSYIMGELFNAITEHKAYYVEVDGLEDQLSQFFEILKKFNLEEPMEIGLRVRIENYF